MARFAPARTHQYMGLSKHSTKPVLTNVVAGSAQAGLYGVICPNNSFYGLLPKNTTFFKKLIYEGRAAVNSVIPFQNATNTSTCAFITKGSDELSFGPCDEDFDVLCDRPMEKEDYCRTVPKCLTTVHTTTASSTTRSAHCKAFRTSGTTKTTSTSEGSTSHTDRNTTTALKSSTNAVTKPLMRSTTSKTATISTAPTTTTTTARTTTYSSTEETTSKLTTATTVTSETDSTTRKTTSELAGTTTGETTSNPPPTTTMASKTDSTTRKTTSELAGTTTGETTSNPPPTTTVASKTDSTTRKTTSELAGTTTGETTSNPPTTTTVTSKTGSTATTTALEQKVNAVRKSPVDQAPAVRSFKNTTRAVRTTAAIVQAAQQVTQTVQQVPPNPYTDEKPAAILPPPTTVSQPVFVPVPMKELENEKVVEPQIQYVYPPKPETVDVGVNTDPFSPPTRKRKVKKSDKISTTDSRFSTAENSIFIKREKSPPPPLEPPPSKRSPLLEERSAHSPPTNPSPRQTRQFPSPPTEPKKQAHRTPTIHEPIPSFPTETSPPKREVFLVF
ncbi:hypothetical protein OSTOST_00731 [Ostertagia ostertagi]